MYNWHAEHPAHVSELECSSLGSNPGRKVTKKRVYPLGDMSRSILELVVSTFNTAV